MNKDHPNYNAYIRILEEELVPAMGCTEPIALAYCAAKAREVLGCLPDKVVIQASGSIIKNVKSVIVPNTNHMKGIPAAAVAGIIAGDASRQLEVIASVTDRQTEQMRAYLENTPITVEHVDNGLTFEIVVTVFHGDDSASVRIVNYHTNIVHIERNGEVLLDSSVEGESESGLTDRSCLNLKDILDFAEIVPVSALKGQNKDTLIDVIFKYLPYGPMFYDEDTVTDQPMRQIAAELIGSVSAMPTITETRIPIRTGCCCAAHMIRLPTLDAAEPIYGAKR